MTDADTFFIHRTRWIAHRIGGQLSPGDARARWRPKKEVRRS